MDEVVEGTIEPNENNDIIITDKLLSAIHSSESMEEIEHLLTQIQAYKAAAQAADEFRHQSVLFAKYEAMALIRVVEIGHGDLSVIKGKWRKAAALWLFGLSQEEREKAIAGCDNGLTIDNYYRKNVVIPDQKRELANAIVDCKNKAKQQLRDKGIVSVSSIAAEVSHKFPRAMRHEVTEGIREAVRKSGGVGIGDESGYYVDPDKKSEYVGAAIKTRVLSIAKDMESIVDLAERCQSKPTLPIKGDGKSLSYAEIVYITMACLGCASLQFKTSNARRYAKQIMVQILNEVSS